MFYPKDLLSDAQAMAMSNEALGIYWKLLCHDWINDGFPELETAIKTLGGYELTDRAGKLRPQEDFENIFYTMDRQFIQHPTKLVFVTNPRLIKERKKQEKNRKEKAKAGRASAKKRARKRTLKVM